MFYSRRDKCRMSPKRRKGYTAIAALLFFAIAQIGVQVGFAEPTTPTTPTPVPQQFIARLATRNNQPITVNGSSATTGASIVTGATIETGADTSATVNLGPLGTLDIAPNTKLILTYDENGNVKATVIAGCAVLTAKKKGRKLRPREVVLLGVENSKRRDWPLAVIEELIPG